MRGLDTRYSAESPWQVSHPPSSSASTTPGECAASTRHGITLSLRRPYGTQIGTARIRRRTIGPALIPGKTPPLETANKHIAAAVSPATSYTVPEDVRTALATRSASQTGILTHRQSVTKQITEWRDKFLTGSNNKFRGSGGRFRDRFRPVPRQVPIGSATSSDRFHSMHRHPRINVALCAWAVHAVQLP